MSAKKKILKLGVMPLEDFQKRTIAIAKGTYKPRMEEPKIWFSSTKNLTNACSEKNRKLLRLIMNFGR